MTRPSSRWKLALCSAAVAGLVSLAFFSSSFELSSAIAADKQEQSAEESEFLADDEIQDLTEDLTVTFSPRLRKLKDDRYSISVTVRNKTKDTFIGPILLIVDSLEPNQFGTANEDGLLEGKEPYFQLIDDDEDFVRLKGRVTRELEFTPRQPLPEGAIDEFALSFRITDQNPPEQDPKERKKDKFKQPSKEELERVTGIQDRWTDRLLANKELVGTATGFDKDGNLVVKVFATHANVKNIPQFVDGVPVEVEVTGNFHAERRRRRRPRRRNPRRPSPPQNPAPPTNPSPPTTPSPTPTPSLDPTDRFSRPVPIGISSGNEEQCSAGTIACRVRDDNGNVFALSNNHVFSQSNNSDLGEDILQPGRVDTGCRRSPADVIGTLSHFKTIDFSSGASNLIDAALASVTAANVGTATPADGYGQPTATPASPFVTMQVQKYGRTTGHTQGRISAINATVSVGYSGNRSARFVDQIIVQGFSSGFILAGDSGSLLVDAPGLNPVGLLYAGSPGGTFGIASPIQDVLDEFGVTIDDGQSATTTTVAINTPNNVNSRPSTSVRPSRRRVSFRFRR